MRPPILHALAVLLVILGLPGLLGAQSSYRDAGASAFRRGDYPAAISLYEKSLNTALKVLREDDVELVERRAELGEVYRAAGRWDDAITQLDYTWKRSRYDAERKQRWKSHEGDMNMGYAEKLGKACLGAGRYEDAIMVFKTTLADAERVDRTEDAMQFAALLADTQFMAGHPDEADASVRHAAELSTQGSVDPALQARALSQLAGLCLRHKRPEAAKPLAERALTLAQQAYAPDGITVSEYQESLASILIATNDLGEAAKHLQTASDTILREESAESARMVEILRADSNLALKRNLPEDALARAEEALTLARKRYPEKDSKTALCLGQVARCQLALNQPLKAQPLFTQALNVLDRTLGEDDPQTVEIREEATKLGPHLIPAKSSAAPDPKK
jgi:tetratricopeptide (TPR) repeat protein